MKCTVYFLIHIYLLMAAEKGMNECSVGWPGNPCIGTGKHERNNRVYYIVIIPATKNFNILWTVQIQNHEERMHS